jgi:hypothetical protein
VQYEADDCLICTDDSGNQVVVAKPWLIRRSPFDGQVVNGISYTYSGVNRREAWDGEETTETQLITPNYFNGAVILAVRHDTNVQVTAGTNVNAEWIEISNARSWAETPEESS